jgi:hypothetical protein
MTNIDRPAEVAQQEAHNDDEVNIGSSQGKRDKSFSESQDELEKQSSNSPELYDGHPTMAGYITGIDDSNSEFPVITRLRSVLERVLSNYSFFNSKLKSQRKKLLLHFGFVYLLMAVLILGIFSIYWGSMVNRGSRLKNLQMLVVIEDDATVEGIPPVIGDSFYQLLQTPEAKYRGTWNVFNLSQWGAIALRNNRSSLEEIQLQIHNQNYWSGLYVKPNASYNWVQAVIDGDSSYNVSDNTIVNTYETGRDFLNMNSYVTPTIRSVETWWLNLQSNVTGQLLGYIEDKSVLSSRGSLDVMTTPITFTFDDRAPWNDYVLVAPSQVGLIYMIIITFFQFNFFADLHKDVAMSKLRPYHYYMYRVFSAIFSYFVISLFMGLVSLACQVDFTVTYGKSGFLVYWMISFLTMIAVGTVNEFMGLLFILFYPPLLGFWLLFWVIINITPTFTPLALSAKFFRYGYAMPIHNSYEASKTVFFDISKNQIGRNIGILVAWSVLSNIILVPVLKLFGSTMGKRAALAAKAAKEKELNQK